MGWMVHDYPSPPPEKPMPICPVCGCECGIYYRNLNGEIIGCDECVDAVNAVDYMDEQEEWGGYEQ